MFCPQHSSGLLPVLHKLRLASRRRARLSSVGAAVVSYVLPHAYRLETLHYPVSMYFILLPHNTQIAQRNELVVIIIVLVDAGKNSTVHNILNIQFLRKRPGSTFGDLE